MNKSIILTSTLFLLFSTVQAGPYNNDLSKCFIEKTTSNEKNKFIRWMFLAISTHPEVEDIVSLPSNLMDESNKFMATMFMELLTKRCEKETKLAIKYEGEKVISSSFKLFGSVAARGLFSHPKVEKAISGMSDYIDEKKLKDIMK